MNGFVLVLANCCANKVQRYPQYCWEFHDRLWEALSGTTSEKRGVPNSGNALEASNALNYRVWGIPAVLSTEIPANALRAFPGSFRNFSGISSGKSQPYWWCGPPFFRSRVSANQFGWTDLDESKRFALANCCANKVVAIDCALPCSSDVIGVGGGLGLGMLNFGLPALCYMMLSTKAFTRNGQVSGTSRVRKAYPVQFKRALTQEVFLASRHGHFARSTFSSQRRRDDNKNKIFAFWGGGGLGGREENRPKRCFSWETPQQNNFERANFIVEKFCCHCAGSYLLLGIGLSKENVVLDGPIRANHFADSRDSPNSRESFQSASAKVSHKRVFTLIRWQPGSANTGFCSIWAIF